MTKEELKASWVKHVETEPEDGVMLIGDTKYTVADLRLEVAANTPVGQEVLNLHKQLLAIWDRQP